MPKLDDNLSNHLITQRSVNDVMPYDAIEKVIAESIDYVKRENINARISNVFFNINNKLVLAQVYVERLNGFALSKTNTFGTSPTSYNVQIRFPFGVESILSKNTVFLPSGDFAHALPPYNTGVKVADDVQRDYEPKDIVCGPGVVKRLSQDTVSITLERDPDQTVEFQNKLTVGKGYVPTAGALEYYDLDDYNERLKTAGIYPLAYSSTTQDRTGLLRKHNYLGYTRANLSGEPRAIIEPQDGSEKKRQAAYHEFIEQMNAQIMQSTPGKYWASCVSKPEQTDQYLFDVTITNGIKLFTQTGLPLTRLWDYQLEAYNSCLNFFNDVNQRNKTQPLQSSRAGVIGMGVGAGKTFLTFTLLQYLKHAIQTDRSQLPPPFCMAPEDAVAEVTGSTINRQGVTTGTSAVAITKKEQMPDAEFLRVYKALTKKAVVDAQKVDDYLRGGLQTDILHFCREKNLHPNTLINLLGNNFSDHVNFILTDDLKNRISTFKDSIDMKRLLLLVEGQKALVDKTGMLGIDALSNLLEQFTAIKEGIIKEGDRPLFRDARAHVDEIEVPVINYKQDVLLVRKGEPNHSINISTLSEQDLKKLMERKYPGNLRAIRDALIKIVCFDDNNLAVILANSGGLGNTYTPSQLQQQINLALPIAVKNIKAFTEKSTLSAEEHYTLFLYLNEIFSTIPAEISLKSALKNLGSFESKLYVRKLQNNIALIQHVEDKIKEKINSLGVENIPGVDETELRSLGIKNASTSIKAANQLAGFASLQMTGEATKDDAKLLLTHIPVFTPEGLASYFEHLASLEGNAKKITFKEKCGVYDLVEQNAVVTKKDIQERLKQIINTVMIADEVHKEEFKCFYDPEDRNYQRINAITQRYLGKPFKDVLPNRIGMSGTVNEVTEKAFGTKQLYTLSTPSMIKRGLTKQVSVETHTVDARNKQAFAQQIVVDYFVQNSTLSIKNILKEENFSVDLSGLSKGLIFSKTPDAELNSYLLHYFNLLLDDHLKGRSLFEQEEMYKQIDIARVKRHELLESKLNGKAELTSVELEQIQLYNRTADNKIDIVDRKIVNNQGSNKKVLFNMLDRKDVQMLHRNAFRNHLYALYLEYMLSKSGTPKECSDIIGLQNRLYEKGAHLINMSIGAVNLKNDEEVSAILASIASVDPSSITKEDVTAFFRARIKDIDRQEYLINVMLEHKNNHVEFAGTISNKSRWEELPNLVTGNRDEFEIGSTLAMIGGERERTGYSHPPVGIVFDVPSDVNNILIINGYINELKTLQANNVRSFFYGLQTLAKNTFSYDEKNQAGGRALRTPYGHAKFVQYQTMINAFLEREKPAETSALLALKLETQFQDIFTSDEQLAQVERASTTFNREALLLLDKDFKHAATFYNAVRSRFAKALNSEPSKQQHEGYFEQRLPLLWAMKYQPEVAALYFVEFNEARLDDIRALMHQPDPERVIEPEPKPGPGSDNPHKQPSIEVLMVRYEERFNALLATLKKKTTVLIAKGTKGTADYSSKYVEAAKVASSLIDELTAAQQQFFKAKTLDKLQFQAQCTAAINTAKPVFTTHRGWGHLHAVVKAILGILAALTVIPALVVAVKSSHGYKGTFFGSQATDAAEKLEDFEKRLRTSSEKYSRLTPAA